MKLVPSAVCRVRTWQISALFAGVCSLLCEHGASFLFCYSKHPQATLFLKRELPKKELFVVLEYKCLGLKEVHEVNASQIKGCL